MLLLLAATLLPIPAGPVTSPFLLGKTEVTQSEYARLTGANPSHYRGPARPVENLTWQQAIAYANKLSIAERLSPCYNLANSTRLPACTGYRLPTSAEWAHAFGKPVPGSLRPTGYQDSQDLLNAAAPGTRPVAQFPPNEYGLHDMAGNVWEWCEDWYSPAPAVDATLDPQGPPTGLEKVIRGGSILTGAAQWNKGLLSGRAPARPSPFTGFRLARSLPVPQTIRRPSPAFLSKFQNHPSAPPPPLSRHNWLATLGTPNLPKIAPPARLIQRITNPVWTGELLDLAIEPQFPTRVLITSPLRQRTAPLPVLLVPYYDVDTPAGADLGGRRLTPGDTRAYARLAAQRGMLAVSIKWYGESDGEGYDEAVFQHARRHPGVTPLGKWIFDLQRIVDYLLTRPDVDPARIGMIGHSLGGKMALYGAAFEPRIKATVSSEPGISLKFSNYQDFWYLGKTILTLPPEADQHDLIARMSPRPFLLIAGESADGDKSWPLLLSAQQAYSDKSRVGMINHRSGHSPTEASIQLAMEWLDRFLNE